MKSPVSRHQPSRFAFAVVALVVLLAPLARATPPNILFIFIDDIGWGDLSCYGSPVTNKLGQPITPNLDTLASQGIRFTDGYVTSPICSPSRVGVLTGTVPARHAIYSFLNDSANNAARSMNNWLQPDVVSAARIFRDAGYATGQFGKWHMGGGRDVNDAPFPQDYGFQSSLVAFEGMGDRVLYLNYGLSTQNADVPGNITWTNWENGADLHAQAAIDFITASVNSNQPFYVHVPFNDTHSPYNTDVGKTNDFDHITANLNAMVYLSELHELDKVIGQIVSTIDSLGVRTNTLIVVIGDNGAPDDNINSILNRNGGLRGGKGNLFEGGFREPFIISMPGTVPMGMVNSNTAVSTVDLLPTYCALAGLPIPNTTLDGENMLDVFKGSTRGRVRPLFWEFGTVSGIATTSPGTAMRLGNFKLLREPNGSNRQFYDLSVDRNEATNQISNPAYAAAIAAMEPQLETWFSEIVLGEVGATYVKFPGEPAGLLVADNYNLPGGNSAGTGFGVNTGVNEGLSNRLSGSLSNLLSYVQSNTSKPASAHSIQNNTLTVADAANPTAFQFSADGSTPYNFGPHLRGRNYEWRLNHDLDDPDTSALRTSLSISDAAGSGVQDVDLGIQLKLEANNTISIYKRIDAASNAGGTDVNATIATGYPPGVPVAIRVVLNDSTDYLSGYNTTYEVFVNGVSKDAGNITFANDSRYLIFDTAPNTGPARYDDFALETLTAGTNQLGRVPILNLSQLTTSVVQEVEKVRLFWTTQPGQVVQPVISTNLTSWTPILEGGLPLEVATDHGTIRWKEVAIPAEYRQHAYIRLKVIP